MEGPDALIYTIFDPKTMHNKYEVIHGKDIKYFDYMDDAIGYCDENSWSYEEIDMD